MERPRNLIVIASLALVQAFIVTLVALIWFGIASIFSPDPGGTSSLMVMLAQAKGGFLILLALMYLVFAGAAWHVRDWAWWLGLLVSVLNLLYLARALLAGLHVGLALFGMMIPLIIIWYLLSSMGRQAFVR